MARTDFRLRVLMEPRHGASYDEILALARAAEDAGFDAFFRSDHLLGVDAQDRTYRPTDCWTTLGGLARDTSRVRLGALVGAATFRAPGLLATIVASVDEMSGGRVELGLGTAWYEREHDAFGIPFPPRGERFDRFEEQLEIITGLWRAGEGEEYSFQGKHYRIDANAATPRTTQRPHPPVIVGGSGPKRTPAIAARFADEFNGALGGDLRERYAVFARACEAIGRDPDEARRSAVLPVACGRTPAESERRGEVMGSALIRANALIGTPAEVTDRVGTLREAGADTVYFHIYDIHDLEHIALLGAEVLPHHVAPPLAAAQRD
ncbi:LLM class F420-dependent oxidoreductase [Amycolatopsis sp. GM8]|uniref:LLM class F420-dependent oxidoreductase n=1 Tax=Amycolatopsis sp. GM8 TaxID=2896530 RepID=UPI001F1F3A5D|nr:LLM class F420-dependent oxidoreductase [Amycolatopsis sp. GM8]